MVRLPQLFRTRSWDPWEKSPKLQIWDNLGWFSFYIENGILCVLIEIASMRRFQWEHATYMYLHVNKSKPYPYNASWSDTVINTQLFGTTPLSNIFSWFQRCSSHWSFTVYCTYTVDSRYLEVEGTLSNTSRYPYFDISDVQNWEKYQSNNQISQMNM